MSEAIASKEERLVAYNANIAAADKDPSLSPETGKPLSKVNTSASALASWCSASCGCQASASSPPCCCRCTTRPSKAPIRTPSSVSSMRSPQWRPWFLT